MSKKIIYVTGLPRSMTTLMCNILANNDRIGGGETSPLLDYVYAARANFSNSPEVKAALSKEITETAFAEFCKHGMDGYAKSITDKEIYLDKSRGWLHYSDFLQGVLPGSKVIVMVRDLRGILSSFEKKWRQNPFILDGRDVPANQAFIAVDQRVNAWLADPPLGLALKRLYNAHQTGTIKDMLVIKAEKLCSNPEQIMRDVYEFIEEPYCELDYNNIKQMTVENDRISDFGIYGDHLIKPKVEPVNKKEYDDILSAHVTNGIRANYKWFYEAFNYV